MFNSLSFINVELTSRCNKQCHMCGRRIIEKKHPHLAKWGDMPIELVEKISRQLPYKCMVQLHNNGESTLYPELKKALVFFKKQITQFDTNGILILEKADEIIDNLDILTISVIEKENHDEQYKTVRRFILKKRNRRPQLVYRLLGDIEDRERWEKLPGLVADRTVHNPMGSFGYRKNPTLPEHGICIDLLTHLSIDRYGMVSPCVRFDPYHEGVIGDIKNTDLFYIWNSKLRREWINFHLMQQRNKIPLCSKCDFYGVATSD